MRCWSLLDHLHPFLAKEISFVCFEVAAWDFQVMNASQDLDFLLFSWSSYGHKLLYYAALVLDFLKLSSKQSVERALKGSFIELTPVGFSIGRWGTFSMKKKPEPTRPEFYGVWHPAPNCSCPWVPGPLAICKNWRSTVWIQWPAEWIGLVPQVKVMRASFTVSWCHKHPGTILGVSEFGRCSLAIQSSWLLGLIESCNTWATKSEASFKLLSPWVPCPIPIDILFLPPFFTRKGFVDFTVLHGVRLDGPPPRVPQEWWPPVLPGRDVFVCVKGRCHVAESGILCRWLTPSLWSCWMFSSQIWPHGSQNPCCIGMLWCFSVECL